MNYFIFSILPLILQYHVIWTQTPCINTRPVGDEDPKDKDGEEDTETGVAILIDQTEYQFTCCGFVNKWEYHSRKTGTTDAQVWRLDSGQSYTLVGSNTLTSTNPGNLEKEDISDGSRIRVMNGDIIGLHSTGEFIVTHDNENNGGDDRYKLIGITTTMTSPYDWSSAALKQEDYAIRGYAEPSEIPSISGLTDVTYFNDDVSVGAVVSTVTASDNDPEDSGNLVLTLQSASNGGTTYFEFSSGSNQITIKAEPPVGIYNLVIKVEDPCKRSSTENQRITIQNRPPVIHNLPDTISISEDTGSNTLLFTINATDTVTDPVPCIMVGGNTNEFKVDTITSSAYGVYTENPGVTFNYDNTPSYTVTVRCDDGDDTVNGLLTIDIIPNEAPVIQSLPESTSFLEDLNTRTLLHTIAVTDAEGDTVSCTLNPTSTIFDVTQIPPTNTDYGIYLTGGTTLDYDAKSSYVVTVECSDQRRSDTETFTVNLIRNTPPVINNLPNSTSISEDLTTKTLIYTLNVTDVNTADIIDCGLNTNTAVFEVSKITATADEYGVFLKSGIVLDFDTTASYSLTIECGDHRRDVTETLTVNIIRNEPPNIVNLPMSYEISEDTVAETLLYIVSVTDPTNDTVTCSITPATTIFYIQSGATQFEADLYIRGNQLLDYDTLRQYTIDITCADQRRSDLSSFYLYLLRNNPPYFINLQGETSISSKTTVIGQYVFTVIALDPENDQLQFTMTAEDTNAPFSINQNTGEISLSRIINTESVPAYDLFISVSDGRNTVGPKSLTIRITEINYPPTIKNLPVKVPILEGIGVGTQVFKPIIEDVDFMDSHTFSVSFVPPEGAVYFDVNATSGIVKTVTEIDYETMSSKTFLLNFTVTDSFMTDNGGLTLNIINVNEAPTFTKNFYTITANENSGGTTLSNPYYQYMDEDGDVLKFSFNCGGSTGRLDMDSATGILSYAVRYDLDQEGAKSQINCEIYINDVEYSDTAYLNITILDDNDNSPAFLHSEYTFFVPVGSTAGTYIGNVQATDDDVGVYGDISYHISQQNLNNGVFAVSANGSITLGQSLTNYAEGSALNFTIYAVDTGGREDVAEINIIIPNSVVEITKDDETIKYYTFFTYAPNMAWFVPLMFLLFIASSVVVYTIHKSVSTCTCSCEKRDKKRRIRARRKRKGNHQESQA